MVHFTAEFSYRLEDHPDGIRIDLPGSSLDGFIARDRQSAESYLQVETKRMVSSLLSSPRLHAQIAELQQAAGTIAPELDLTADLKNMIVYFPGDEMLSLQHTTMFLKAVAGWLKDQGRSGELLTRENYATFLNQAQAAIRNLTIEKS